MTHIHKHTHTRCSTHVVFVGDCQVQESQKEVHQFWAKPLRQRNKLQRQTAEDQPLTHVLQREHHTLKHTESSHEVIKAWVDDKKKNIYSLLQTLFNKHTHTLRHSHSHTHTHTHTHSLRHTHALTHTHLGERLTDVEERWSRHRMSEV